MVVLKYSGSYGNTENNFVLFNIDSEKRIEDDTLYGLLCVVQNIIQRGMVSIPSEYLRDKLGELGCVEEPCFFVAEKESTWNLIKGDEENIDYPAETFLNQLLPKYLEEYAYVRNLTVPEAEFSDIIGRSTILDGQQVDFYIPQIRTVIEIDGGSHLKTFQIYKDKVRDRELERENINVIRISTSDLRKETKQFKDLMKDLKKKIAEDARLPFYKIESQIEQDNIRLQYDVIYRLQIMILECLKHGILDINKDTINVKFVGSVIPNSGALVRYAYEDLRLWLEHIAQLLKKPLRMPKLVVREDVKENLIQVDISMFARYTDTTVERQNVIYIRNDYFCDSNFYKVSTADTLQYHFPVESAQDDDKALTFLLKNIFGFNEYNVGQIPIIKHTLERNDTIGILPTGGGKSLTYQVCALLQPGVTMVIVPIISLMQDQKRGMDIRGINHTSYISSAQMGSEKSKVLDDFMGGKYQLIWISPERFQNQEFRESLVKINREMNFALAVIDEVHCLSEWGHDFRVSYLALIHTIREYCPEACLLGLTATASQAVLEDLKAEFENDGSGVKSLTSMDRKELIFDRIHVYSQMEKYQKIASLVKASNIDYTNQNGETKHQIGLVFCPTVGGKGVSCDNVIDYLKKEKIVDRLSAYHGKLSMERRVDIQNQFMDDAYDVMICTKAFGMGIDKDNIKYTIHTCLPQSVESFYQEAGRAGREKDKSVKSHCYILYTPEGELYQHAVKKIFRADTEIEERKFISEHLENDLRTIMYFWNLNRKTVEEEYANISAVLKKLYLGKHTLAFNNGGYFDFTLDNIQVALYKLSLLGIVQNWTVQYASLDEGTVDVEYVGVNEKEIENHLLSYIHKYDVEFRIDVETSRYKKYFGIVHNDGEKIVTRYIKTLIEWSNDNVLYNRLQSTYTMLQWMDEGISDDQFRRNLIEYFKFSEQTVIFEGIIYNPLEYNNWFDILYTKEGVTHIPVNEEIAEANLAALQRYLESYRNNTGLNFLSGILRIMTGKYRGSEGEWRLQEALDNIKETLDYEQQMEIINRTLDVGRTMKLEYRDLLSHVLISKFNGIERRVYDKLEDRYSLSMLLDNYVEQIDKIVKENF